MGSDYDICVIGGGVNGAGIARDAAGRGLRTLLVEAQDLASATSSASTKLIHGGLRYLEQYDFGLVRESLIEREVLYRAAPHIIWPMDFCLPHSATIRPAWLIRLGLFLYDHIGGRKLLKGSRQINLQDHDFGRPLKRFFKKAFTYQDCWVEDSRLVALNAQDAKARGADVLTYTGCMHIEAADKDRWKVDLKDMTSGNEFSVTARAVINAGGPWVRSILEASNLEKGARPAPNVRLIKGSHIIVDRLFEGEQAYILQQTDRRIIFAIPYEKKYTLIGTTDVEYHADPSNVQCSPDEIEYLCQAASMYFDFPITPQQVLWTYSGVRPLISDGKGKSSEVSRGYKFHLDETQGAPLLSVYGGKITSYRKLAEHAVDTMCEVLDHPVSSWTESYALPGGRIPPQDFDGFVQKQKETFSWLPESVIERYARTYGSRMDTILGHATDVSQLGRDCGQGVYEAELVYSIHYEFTKTVEDFLWRRTKLGLHLAEATLEKIRDIFPSVYDQVKNKGKK